MSIVGCALAGAATNFLAFGSPLARAALGTLGNLAEQATNPCFNDFYCSKALTAGALDAYGIGERFPPNLLSNAEYIAHEAASQVLENYIEDAAE